MKLRKILLDMKYIFLLLLIVTFIMGLTSCGRSAFKPIEDIYIYFSGFGMVYPEYKLDFKDKKFWEFQYSGEYSDFVPRDEAAANEGFTFVKDLDEDKIAAFMKDAKDAGFADWKEEYKNKSVLDGLQWGMTISFSDGTKKEMQGSNAFPSSWEKMKRIFAALTGKEILQGSNKEYNR